MVKKNNDNFHQLRIGSIFTLDKKSYIKYHKLVYEQFGKRKQRNILHFYQSVPLGMQLSH